MLGVDERGSSPPSIGARAAWRDARRRGGAGLPGQPVDQGAERRRHLVARGRRPADDRLARGAAHRPLLRHAAGRALVHPRVAVGGAAGRGLQPGRLERRGGADGRRRQPHRLDPGPRARPLGERPAGARAARLRPAALDRQPAGAAAHAGPADPGPVVGRAGPRARRGPFASLARAAVHDPVGQPARQLRIWPGADRTLCAGGAHRRGQGPSPGGRAALGRFRTRRGRRRRADPTWRRDPDLPVQADRHVQPGADRRMGSVRFRGAGAAGDRASGRALRGLHPSLPHAAGAGGPAHPAAAPGAAARALRPDAGRGGGADPGRAPEPGLWPDLAGAGRARAAQDLAGRCRSGGPGAGAGRGPPRLAVDAA